MRRKRRPQPGIRKGIALLPNLLTTGNLFCGYFSIVKTLQGQYEFAAWMVVLAGFFDFMDGRVARMTKTTSDFGVQYDSLSDLATFCMAPSLLMYHWALQSFNRVGIAACFLYFACGALRLARFNVQSGTVEKVHFQGLPSPSAAGLLVSYVLFSFHLELPQQESFVAALVLTVLAGLLMVSKVEYISAKGFKRASFFFFVCILALAFVILIRPEVMLFVVGVTYISAGLIRAIVKSPQSIKNFRKILLELYHDHKEERWIYDDEDDVDAHDDRPEDTQKIVRLAKDNQ